VLPGTWLLRDLSPQAGSRPCGRATASYLRLLKTVCGALASRFTGRRLTGRILVSDFAEGDGSLSVSLAEEGGVEALWEISSRRLLEDSEAQAAFAARVVSAARPVGTQGVPGSPVRQADRNAAAGRHPVHGLGEPRGLVQFVHGASLLESRERRFSSVPPAAFCMAPALQRAGFQVAVDSLLLEPFAAPGPFPAAVHEASRNRLDRLLQKKPFCIAITAMDFCLEELRCLLREIRSRDRDVVIAVGGPLVTLYPEKAPVFLPEGNVFIRGEADFALGETLAALGSLHAGKNPSETEISRVKRMEGLFLRVGETVLVSNLDRTNRVGSLDAVFSGGVDLGFIRKRHVSGGLHLHTTRGCPFRCAFCSKVHGSQVRAMSENTIFLLLAAYGERVEEIRKTEGLTEAERRQAFEITFSDDDFLLARSRARAFFPCLSDRPFCLRTVPSGIPSFLTQGKPGERVFDPALFEAIGAAQGCIRAFEIGTDDFSERELSRLAKGDPGGYTPGEIEEVVGRLEDLKISNRHFVILSNPATRWSDLFEKLIALEDLSWSYPHFYPDPNPFVLAPAGTPLFDEMVRQGRADALQGRTFAVPGFPEFTHRVFNMALPEERLFATDRRSAADFFRRLCDLLKSGYRFSILEDAYPHFLGVCDRTGSIPFETEEKERILDKLTRAATLRTVRISSAIRGTVSLPARSGPARGWSLVASLLSGMLLLRETAGRVFPEDGLSLKRERLLGTLETFFDEIEQGHPFRQGLPDSVCRRIDQALRFGRSQIGLYRAAAGCAGDPSPVAKTFVREIEARLMGNGRSGEVEEWRALCSRLGGLVRLEVSRDRREARFVEDEPGITRLFDLAGGGGSGVGRPEDAVRFLRAECVLAKSIQDDFLGNSETRVALYEGLAGLPLDFVQRFQEEFGLSPVFDKEKFLTSLLAKFLAGRKLLHSEAMHGTFLFDGFEDVLREIVPPGLAGFADWFFGKKGGIRS
jgi:hypothetical protein